MPLEVSRFSFYCVILNFWCCSDLFSVHEVMPLTLASPTLGHGHALIPPDWSRRWQEHLPAVLCCALVRSMHTHTRYLAAVEPRPCSVPSVPAPAGWQISWGQPDLSGVLFHGEGERLRRPASSVWGASDGVEKREVWGLGSAASHRLREASQPCTARIRWTHISLCCHHVPKGTGFQTEALFC